MREHTKRKQKITRNHIVRPVYVELDEETYALLQQEKYATGRTYIAIITDALHTHLHPQHQHINAHERTQHHA